MPSKTTPQATHKKLNRKIQELHAKPYLPAGLVSLAGEVCKLQYEVADSIRSGEWYSNNVQEGVTLATSARHLQGEPLLLRKDFPVNIDSAAALAPSVYECIEKHTPELAGFAHEVSELFSSNTCSFDKACEAILYNPLTPGGIEEGDFYYPWAQAHPNAPFFLNFIVQSCMLPSITIIREALAMHRDAEQTWEHGHCPICGSLPLIGRLQGKEGKRMHVCSFCFYEYRVPRMGCSFCLKHTNEGEQYFSSEDEAGYTANICSSCKSYIKIADFREFDRVFLPMLDDLASLVLDLHMRKEGYMRPTLSAWGF